MPYAFVIELQPTIPGPTVSSHDLPRYAHALFFSILNRFDDNVAAAVHAAQRKPFTLYPWQEANGTLFLRVGLLSDDLFDPIVREFVSYSEAGMYIGTQRHKLTRILGSPRSHTRSGFCSWQALGAEPWQNNLTLEFITPTVFATSKPGGRSRFTPLPDPSLVFRSLMSSWQAHCPDASRYANDPVHIVEKVEWDVVVSNLNRVYTRAYPTGRARLTGFVGSVSFRTLSPDIDLRRTINMLARYAFFAGVGAKTTTGMGQVHLPNLRFLND